MRRALDRTGSVKYIAHTRPTPAEPTEEIPPSKASVVAAAKSKRVNATWAMAPSLAGVLVPLVFGGTPDLHFAVRTLSDG